VADLALSERRIQQSEVLRVLVKKSRKKNKLARMLPGQTVSFNAMSDRCASSGHQMPDDRDHGKYQKQMDQTARDVESCESQNPKHEQNNTDKQKHVVPPQGNFIKAFRLPASRIRVLLQPLHHNQFLKTFARGNLRR
jgi:hypothetical protein